MGHAVTEAAIRAELTLVEDANAPRGRWFDEHFQLSLFPILSQPYQESEHPRAWSTEEKLEPCAEVHVQWPSGTEAEGYGLRFPVGRDLLILSRPRHPRSRPCLSVVHPSDALLVKPVEQSDASHE